MKRTRLWAGHIAVAAVLACGGTENDEPQFGPCGETVSVEDVCRAQVAMLQRQDQLGAPCNLSESNATVESCVGELARSNCSQGALCFFQAQFEVWGECLETVPSCSNDQGPAWFGRLLECAQTARSVPIPIDEIGPGCIPPP